MSRASSRRTFLRSVGSVAAGLPFFGLLERSAFGAPASGPALRFVGINHWQGRPLEFWRPKPGFVIDYLDCCLQPFDDPVNRPARGGGSLKSKLVVLDGITNVVANECNKGGHGAGASMWTGSVQVNDAPRCASLETFLSTQTGLAGNTPFPTTLYNAAAHGPDGRTLSAYSNPGWLFSSLFQGFMPPGQQNAQAQLDAVARGKSSLDYVTGSLTRLQSRLASTEKSKLDQHLTAVRQIESRLMAPPSMTCRLPTNPDPNGSIRDDKNTDGDWVNARVLEILVQALACDLTRFIQWSLEDTSNPIGSSAQDPGVNPPIPPVYPPAGQMCADGFGNTQDCVHLNVAHRYRASSPFTIGGGGSAADITSQVRLARAKKYGYDLIASFASQLDALQLLDSTLMMTMDDVGDPALHDSSGLPCILVGGANGALKMGQHLTLPTDTPQNHVFNTICKAFGLPGTSYGVSANSSTTTGTVAGLLA